MSVPRRLGAGGLSEVFDSSGSTLAMQPRHPGGFPSPKDDSDSASSSALSSPHCHAYTEQLSSSSSTHIATTGLQSLSLHQHQHGHGQPFSPSTRHQQLPSSPQTSLSCASTVTNSTTPSPSSTFSINSPGSSSTYNSPAPHFNQTPSANSPLTATFVSTYSTTSSTSSSPIASPLLTRRNASNSSKPPVSPSSSSLRFPSPFKSLKTGGGGSASSSSSLLSAANGASPHHNSLSAPLVHETINSIMQEDTTAPSSSSLSKSPGSPRPLYSPKPSPGVRPNIASPAPSASSSASASVSYTTLPAIDRVHRYVVTGTLQQSLFGVVKLAFDRVLKQQVAIKISRRERAQQQQTRSGVSVLENVRREAAVMQYLHERSAAGHLHRTPIAHRKSLYAEMFAHMTVNEILNNHKQSPAFPSSSTTPSGSSVGGKKAKRMSSRATTHTRVNDERMMDDDASHSTPINAVHPFESDSEFDSEMRTAASTPSSRYSAFAHSATSPPSASSQSSSPTGAALPSGPIDASDLEGERYICKYVEELEDEHFHYLVTDFIPAGDLYSMLTSFPQHRLSEVQARGLFRQMVLGVKYLHLRNVAHLDMSLENMCLDMNDDVRIIDFGVAALHPFTPTAYQTSYFSFPSASSPISFPPSSSPQSTSPNTFLPRLPSASSSPSPNSPCVPTPHRSFLCKPVKELYSKPGKIRYMSPELFQGVAWDAYANDVFSLGVILYSLLTGRPPFQQAESSDVWFHVIYSGQWLTPQIRKQPSAHVYTHLSDGALSLINLILKPQEMRPTCEQILQHPWMQME